MEQSKLVEYYDNLTKEIKEKCFHCLCKNCSIAEINGGAPGCGDCYECRKNNFYLFHSHCCDYYSTIRAPGDHPEYWIKKEREND